MMDGDECFNTVTLCVFCFCCALNQGDDPELSQYGIVLHVRIRQCVQVYINLVQMSIYFINNPPLHHRHHHHYLLLLLIFDIVF